MIKVGMKVKLPVEKIEVTITSVSQDGSKIRYEGENGERGVLLTEKLNAWQVFEAEEAKGRSIMEMIEERFSNFNIVIKSKTAHNFLKMTCNEIRPNIDSLVFCRSANCANERPLHLPH